MASHTSSHFHQELEKVRTQVLHMGGLVENQLYLVLNALHHADTTGLIRIVQDDDLINRLEIDIDDACQTIIARRQPTASDLRFVLAVSRMIVDLERVGDELKKIALILGQVAKKYELDPKTLHDTHRLAGMTRPMLRRALDAFARLDITALDEVYQADKLIDDDYRSQSRVLMTYMMQEPKRIELFVELLMINKSAERIGDHAKNIAEHVVYLVQGIDVRHHKVKGRFW